ncbi:MAG: T9SS type A sorting domain-containing protein [Candidatus Eisenbacteria bacterium]|nr:T9SS type A sorting domain-containing protein [Candidatus Eisenbacteria bacterium]
MNVGWDGGPGYVWSTFVWADTGWRNTFRSNTITGGLPEFAVQDVRPRTMIDIGTEDRNFLCRLAVQSVNPDSIAPPDSIGTTVSQSSDYAAAASNRRRWAIRSEQRRTSSAWFVRVYYSDTTRIWHEVEPVGIDEFTCSIAPLGDTTAMIAYAGESGLQYAILDGARWVVTGNLDPRPWSPVHPRLRLRPSGGLWLFWADYDWMHMSSYKDGVWSRGDSVQCIPNAGETFRPIFLDAEHDTTEYPVLAWTNSGYGDTWRDVTAIAFPNGHGWDPGEEVPDSQESGWFSPTMTTDLNGDVWVAWRLARYGINRWTHTYCSATCAAPAVALRGDGVRLSWALTSRAPGSRWSVWRAAGDGAFDSLGTVRAGEDSVLTFDDAIAFPGQTWRYRIRRESVDVRYRWESDVATHWRPDTRAPIGLTLTNPTSGARLAFRLSGAAGLLWVRLYDLQGRQVLHQRLAANGTGEDSFTLDLGGSGARRPGMYFLRVSDGTLRTTRTARVAVIR